MTCCNKKKKLWEEIIYQWRLHKLKKKLHARRAKKDVKRVEKASESSAKSDN